jgi:hypothetical protein
MGLSYEVWPGSLQQNSGTSPSKALSAMRVKPRRILSGSYSITGGISHEFSEVESTGTHGLMIIDIRANGGCDEP